MKKVFFAFVAVSVVILSACNNKPAEVEATTVDSTVTTIVEETTTTTAVDSTVTVDSTTH